MEGNFERNYLIRSREVPLLLTILFVIYTFLSYFETYLGKFIGTNTRYVMILVGLVFLYYNKWKIKRSIYIVFFCLWFVFKLISIAWSSGANTDVSRLFLSQIGIVFFLCAVCGQVNDKKFIRTILQANYWCSFAFGLLSMRFHATYNDERFVARQVLTLWGQQHDPNNCAVFLAIGISIAAYSLITDKRFKWLNVLVILVNAYGIMLTASRTGFLLMVVVILILALMPNRNDEFATKNFIKRLVIIVAIMFIAGFLVLKYLPKTSLNRMIAFDEYAGGSGRAEKWNQAFELFLQRPFFGWGWGGYFVGSGIVHNTFLTMLCDVGFFGTTLFLIPLFYLAFRLIKNKYKLAFLLLATGIFPSIAIDSINKRYFWNAIIIAIMMLDNLEIENEVVELWPERTTGVLSSEELEDEKSVDYQ